MLLFTEHLMNDFEKYLYTEEKSAGTRENYLRAIRAYAAWLNGREATRESAVGWKEALAKKGFAAATVNTMLAAVNALFRFAGLDCKVKYLRKQRRLFRDESRELTREEYERLVSAAREQGKERLALALETMGGTGIRVSELRYITREAVAKGRADISLKGKIRTILIPNRLRRKLEKYAKKRRIASGEIFRTRTGRSLCRMQIWAEMKAICKKAGVEKSKVFPHNLRHLFARAYYRAHRDIVRLADILGHSSIETTRIYLISTCVEYVREIERLDLIS